ncbi:MAG TPA: hypothetical protein VFP65_28805, partial [Anaeromyxobacteraceae bacterium]|nr:hypothetical protein [Anaeromyxobacteraceae bacterium]
LAFAALAAAPGCARAPERPAGPGRRVAEGEVLSLRPSADGAFLALLRGCTPVKDRTLPPGTATCELAVVPSAGGEARSIAAGVTTLPHGFGWSGEGHALAALAAYAHAAGAGALVAWWGAEPRRLAEGVSFYAFDRPGARLGYAAGGRLWVAPVAGGAAAEVAGGEAVTTFEFGAREGIALLARRSAQAGGDLLAVSGAVARPVAPRVQAYAFAPDARRFAFTAGHEQELRVARAAGGPPTALGREVRDFAFSPRGDAIAYVKDAAPGRQGDLWLAAGEAAPVRLGARVGELRWSDDGARLAWLQDYDPRSRTGTLASARPGEKPEVLAPHVSDLDLAGADAIAFLVHETAGGYSVDLSLWRAGGAAARKVERGVFGFSFSPDRRWLYYRSGCVREAEACDLWRAAVAGSGAPERVAEGVKSFEYAPGRPDRLLVSWARKDRVALDLALWEGGRLTALDTLVRPGTASFLGRDPRRLAWAVLDPRRQGVWVAEVP